jgi:hypothetical protein
MENFTIGLTYGGISYKAIVTPEEQNGMTAYHVQLESENQESFVDIIAKPPGSGTDLWTFTCPDDQEPPENYDKKLLDEIGEAIEKNEINSNDQ